MPKQFLFTVLAAALTFGVLTGCGEKSESSGKAEKSEKSEKSEESKPLPPLDMKLIAGHEARGIEFSEDKRTLVKFNKDLYVAEYAIPSGVTTIDDGAFAWCTSLKSVTIPSSVTTIGGSAFVGCSSLTSVTIPSSVTTIGKGAFA